MGANKEFCAKRPKKGNPRRLVLEVDPGYFSEMLGMGSYDADRACWLLAGSLSDGAEPKPFRSKRTTSLNGNGQKRSEMKEGYCLWESPHNAKPHDGPLPKAYHVDGSGFTVVMPVYKKWAGIPEASEALGIPRKYLRRMA